MVDPPLLSMYGCTQFFALGAEEISRASPIKAASQILTEANTESMYGPGYCMTSTKTHS